MKWFSISHDEDTGTAYVTLSGELCELCGTVDEFTRELGDVATVELSIDCLGGSAGIGFKLHDLLRTRDTVATVTRCGSAATLPMLAAKQVRAYSTARFVLHSCADLVYGNPEALRSAASELDTLREKIAALYRTRCPAELVDLWLTGGKDFWLDAAEAKAAGLVDEIIPEPPLPPMMKRAAAAAGVTMDESEAMFRSWLAAMPPVLVHDRDKFLRHVSEWVTANVRAVP